MIGSRYGVGGVGLASGVWSCLWFLLQSPSAPSLCPTAVCPDGQWIRLTEVWFVFCLSLSDSGPSSSCVVPHPCQVRGSGRWSWKLDNSKDLQETLRPLLCRQVSSHRTQSFLIAGRSLQGSRLFNRRRGVLKSARNFLEPQCSYRRRAGFRDLDLRSALVGFILEEGFVNWRLELF